MKHIVTKWLDGNEAHWHGMCGVKFMVLNEICGVMGCMDVNDGGMEKSKKETCPGQDMR